MKPWVLLAAALVLGCSFLADPEGGRHDRFVFASPEQVVTYVYQNLAAGRYAAMREAFLNSQDRRAWMVYDEQHHPWTGAHAQAEIVGTRDLEGGDVEVTVRERWSGGEALRRFRCHLTSDGWRVQSVEGQPGEGLLE